MKMTWTHIAGLAAVLVAAPVSADELSLAKSKGCMGCHAIDKKVVGPAWQDVAAKYKGDAAAKDTLMTSLKNGSKGKWGPIQMPPQASLSDAERAQLAQFVLSLAK